jgi:hypothetical protein
LWTRGGAIPQWTPLAVSRAAFHGVAAACLAVWVPHLWAGLLADDFVFVFRPLTSALAAEAFKPGADGSFRPVGVIFLAAQSSVFGFS